MQVGRSSIEVVHPLGGRKNLDCPQSSPEQQKWLKFDWRGTGHWAEVKSEGGGCIRVGQQRDLAGGQHKNPTAVSETFSNNVHK